MRRIFLVTPGPAILLLVFAIEVFAIEVVATEAAAAPQILALTATGPIPLQCQGGLCSAEFSTVCLERTRESPKPGSAYLSLDPGVLTLEGRRRDGSLVALDAAVATRIDARRGHSVVRISVPSTLLERFAVEGLRLSVGRNATLVPVAEPGDPRPHSASDIDVAAGPLRAAATAVVETPSATFDAAGLLLGMANSLPRVDDTQDAEIGAVRTWIEARRESTGYRLARIGLERCGRSVRRGMVSLGRCLRGHHDALMGRLNRAYWDAVENGS